MSDPLMITVDHFRLAGGKVCVRGAMQWFRLHGLDFNDFLRNGIAVETVRPLNDAFANMLIKIAEEENQ